MLHLLIEREEYTYGGHDTYTVKYTYRSDLNYYSEVEKTVITAEGLELSAEKSWDNLNRITGFKYLNNDNHGLTIDISYLPRKVHGVGTTNYIGEWRYRQFAGQASNDRRVDAFEYDANGNVTHYMKKVMGVSYDVRYEYDSANRLIRENNQHLNKTYTYSYDANGNIIAKQEYAYTTAALGAPAQNNYYDADRLMSWYGKSFTYDQCGNPTLYKGDSMTWMRGRLLKSYTKGGQKYEFDYDASGERFVKKIGDKATHYYSINGRLIREERADGTIINFLYGSGGIIGCVVDGKIYFYAKNIFGDVVAIYDYNSGNPVARYAYDAWGNHKVLTPEGNESTAPQFVGNINPIRYRSYYWDDDVKLYYLHTRWYDPEIGRFVNMAQLECLAPKIVNGLNLYTYCLNNPMDYSTPLAILNHFSPQAAASLQSTMVTTNGSSGGGFSRLNGFGAIGWELRTSLGFEESDRLYTGEWLQVGESSYTTYKSGRNGLRYVFAGATVDAMNIFGVNVYAGAGVNLFGALGAEIQLEMGGIGGQISLGRYSIATSINGRGRSSITFGRDTDLGDGWVRTDAITIGINTPLSAWRITEAIFEAAGYVAKGILEVIGIIAALCGPALVFA